MGPYKKNSLMAIYSYQSGVEPIVSPSCPPIDSQLPHLRIQLFPTKKKQRCHTNPDFPIRGSFSNRKKALLVCKLVWTSLSILRKSRWICMNLPYIVFIAGWPWLFCSDLECPRGDVVTHCSTIAPPIPPGQPKVSAASGGCAARTPGMLGFRNLETNNIGQIEKQHKTAVKH